MGEVGVKLASTNSINSDNLSLVLFFFFYYLGRYEVYLTNNRNNELYAHAVDTQKFGIFFVFY